jgi:hypothetical protein
MIFNRSKASRTQVNRRAFLRGVGGISLGLPFLESLPERSAWGQNNAPVFSFFMVSACGVEQNRFWPAQQGALSSENMSGRGVEPLADFSDKLLLVSGVNFPGNLASCGHAEGLVQCLTGVPPGSTGQGAQSGGISADMAISKAVNSQGTDPLSLYSGAGNYIAERISFAGAGTARPMQLNPYAAFQTLLGVAEVAPSTPSATTTPEPSVPTNAVDEVLIRRKSVNDAVRDEFAELLALGRLSADDRARMEQHMNAVREIEVDLMATGDDMAQMAADDPTVTLSCSTGNIDQAGIEAFKGGVQFSQQGNMIEDIVRLHGEVVALAFACNQNRVAVLQWGDGTDGTRYAGLQSSITWPFHQVSHRVQSDSAVGSNADAELAHAEIDKIRLTTLASIIKAFDERGLLSQSFIYWTSHVAAGNHSYRNIPVVIAGSGGGYFKQGQYVSGSSNNGALLAAMVEAAGAGSSFANSQPLAAVKA